LAFTVTVVVPVAAVLLAVNVRVELPLPGAAIELGLKLAVTPAGKPDTESETTALNPPLTVVEIVLLPEPPCATDKLLGEALRVKSGVAAAVIVRETVVLLVMPPPVALTVTFTVPVVAVLLAVNESGAAAAGRSNRAGIEAGGHTRRQSRYRQRNRGIKAAAHCS
jgi:hypothetical protein